MIGKCCGILVENMWKNGREMLWNSCGKHVEK